MVSIEDGGNSVVDIECYQGSGSCGHWYLRISAVGKGFKITFFLPRIKW